jgi:polar amino acid transport system permease protein
MFDWRWDFVIEIMPRLLWATLNTLMAAGIGYGSSLPWRSAHPTRR